MDIRMRIGSRLEVASWAWTWPTLFVAAVDHPDEAAPGRDACRREIFVFDDVADHQDPAAFTPALAGRVVEVGRWLGTQPGSRVLVHCHAGIRRSPAMALGLLCAAGMEPNAAIEAVLAARPQAAPNALVVHLLDRALPDAGLWRSYVAWARHQPWRRIDADEVADAAPSVVLDRLRRQTHRRVEPRG